MSGSICVMGSEPGRFAKFHEALHEMLVPEGTTFQYRYPAMAQLGVERNEAILQARREKKEWLFFIDDDHLPDALTLAKLLAHDKPLVGGLYLSRRTPFGPIMAGAPTANGKRGFYRLTPEMTGLVQVEACGGGVMLVRSEVWESVPEPWFERETMGDDLKFCEKVRAKGIEIFVDVDCAVPHLAVCGIVPVFVNGEWVTQVNVDRTGIRIGRA